jgi:hypothetical protein
MQGKHRERASLFILICGDCARANSPRIATNDSSEHRWAVRRDDHLDEAGSTGEGSVRRWNVDNDVGRIDAVVEPVSIGHVFGRIPRRCRVVWQEAGASQRRGIRRVLLVSFLDQYHPDVERHGGCQQDHEDAKGEQDQDLASLVLSLSC